jgi:hypothetical protein
MIDARELRLGNLLDYQGQPLPVLAIDNEREFFYTERNELLKCSITIGQYDDNGFMWTTNGRWLKHFKPIPLTEDWLVRLGFRYYKETNGYAYRIHFRIQFVKSENGFMAYIDNTEWHELKYVHQLQNLYFALTGEELEQRN